MKICSGIAQLKPYQAGKPISELAREFQLEIESISKLASNENPLPPSDQVIRALSDDLSAIHRYPDSNGYELKTALAAHLSIDKDQLILGNGSNDILELVARACVCQPEDEVIFSQYAFAVYPLITQALGAKAVVTPAKRYGHDLTAMLAAISAKTKLIFIANPNNPTGTFVNAHALDEFLQNVPRDITVALDEAYFEYLPAPHPTLSYLTKYDNLIITRTFSKAYALAGLRVGYGISNPLTIDYLNRIRQPFNVNHLAQVAAIAALRDQAYVKTSIALNQQGLAELSQGFDNLGLSYIPCATNFISVHIPQSQKVFARLLQFGIIVRVVEMPDFIRITVGSQAENRRLLNTLARIL